MNKLIFGVILAVAVSAALGDGGVVAQTPPLPTNRYVSQFPVSAAPAQYDVVHLVLDFAPGAFTRLHSHAGPAYVTILEGQITRIEGGKETVFGPGQTFTEPQGVLHEAGNRGNGRARLMASLLLSPGQPATINHPDAEARSATPTTVFLSRTTLGTQPAEFTLMQVVVDFGPGAYIPPHTHGGPGLVTVLDGEVAFINKAGEVRHKPGGLFIDVDSAHDARNVGPGASTALATFLIRRGAAITSFVTPAPAPVAAPVVTDATAARASAGSPVGFAPPRAGEAGLVGQARESRGLSPVLVAAIAVRAPITFAAAKAVSVRRRTRQ